MAAFLSDFITILEAFFPRNMDRDEALYAVGMSIKLRPLLQMHHIQQREPRQPQRTAWYKSIVEVFRSSFDENSFHEMEEEIGVSARDAVAFNLADNIDAVYDFLGFDSTSTTENTVLYPTTPFVLLTPRQVCAICPTDELHSLRRIFQPKQVRYLDKSYTWSQAILFIACCPRCDSRYYPDRYTYFHDGRRRQKLEYDSIYIRISKRGIWVHRSIAEAQEHAVFRFRCGWSNFSGWLNDILGNAALHITNRQSQRLFIEHMTRRLLNAHGQAAEFNLQANSSTQVLASAVCDVIGNNGGRIPSSLHHACQECTHKKRFLSDLIAEGATFNEEAIVAGLDNNIAGDANVAPAPGPPPQQAEHEPGQPRGYVRMAVMDGKTIGHRICALNTCTGALVNYKNGRFCADHLNMSAICGIVPCGEPTTAATGVTCGNVSHQNWYRSYSERFGRLSFPGVRRVIRRQNNPTPGASAFTLNIEQQLPNLGDTPGNEVSHTFRARSVYCVQTVQWACRIPIGWGKCYNSESTPQVVEIISRIWLGNEDLRPSFVAYDDACDLLRHITTQDDGHGWLQSTKFIVDAWHYIGHRASDILCRLWCNPAPTNGSQPDLIIVEKDVHGHPHSTRAFNTETAEHFNSWLTGFETQLSQMTRVNFDFFLHSLFLLFKDDVERKISKRSQELDDDFWEENPDDQ